jgi:hypothetical protein
MKIAPVLAVVAIAASCPACSVDQADLSDDPVLTAAGGSLTIDWTIQGSSTGNECAEVSANAIEIVVRDVFDQPIGTFQQSCSAFVTSIVLDEGIYAADARLVGPVGPRTEVVRIDYVTLYDKSQLTTSIDFPATAFLR